MNHKTILNYLHLNHPSPSPLFLTWITSNWSPCLHPQPDLHKVELSFENVSQIISLLCSALQWFCISLGIKAKAFAKTLHNPPPLTYPALGSYLLPSCPLRSAAATVLLDQTKRNIYLGYIVLALSSA